MKRKKLLIVILIMLIAVMAEFVVLRYTKNGAAEIAGSRDGAASGIISGSAEAAADVADRISPDHLASSHIYSHRGTEGAIEHSFEAYDTAIEAGSRYIEQDIVISGDGTLYVSHDTSAYGMTGVSGEYEDMTDAEIDELRTYRGKRILRLSDVFDRYGRTVNYVIELKTGDEKLIRSFEELIDKYGYEDIVTAQCRFLSPLSILKEKYPEMPMIYICRSQQQISEGMTEPYVDIVGARINYMSADNCDAVHDAGKKFCVWTVNTRDEIETAIGIGVDTYFTNDTALAMSVEKEKRLHLGG